VIRSGLRTFLDVGNALLDIREARLYRSAYESFDSYCQSKWGMSKTHANRLIASAVTVKQLGDVAALPANEAQVRPLTLLPADQQAEAWERVLKVSGVRLTASAVQGVVDEMLEKGKATQLHLGNKVRWVDRDLLVRELEKYCAKNLVHIPEEVLVFLKKF
jgi:hypothetical protein